MNTVKLHFESAAEAQEYLRAHTEVRPSTICKRNLLQKIFPSLAEQGLFATKPMPKGTLVGQYTGRSVTENDVRQNLDIDLTHVIWDSKTKEGIYSKRGLARANHQREGFNMTHGDELTWKYGDFDY